MCVCGQSAVCVCVHKSNGISILMCLIIIITRPIILPNNSNPLVAELAVTFHKAVKHFEVTVLVCVRDRDRAGPWVCPEPLLTANR